MREQLKAVLDRLIPTGSVTQRTVRSGIWRGATMVSTRSFQILMLIILARLLTPRDFGLLGIALLSLGATKQFTKIGLNAALIHQAKENVDDYLDTTWVLEAGRGFILSLILFLAAPWIAIFFGEPEATNLVRVIALSPLIYGVRNPGVVYFKKDLAFHKDFLYRASGGWTQFVVGVGYALISPTVWALVFAFLARDLVELLLSYVLHPYRPWPTFDLTKAMELIHYGKWITGSSIISFLYTQGDDAFVGWYLSATALGFYQYAYQIADTPSTEVAEIIAQVAFPAYSKLQDQPQQLRQAVLQTTRFTSFIAFPMAFGIALIAPSFVPSILGPDWNPMIPLLQLLAMYGLLHAISRHFGSVWKAVGRPDYTTKMPLVGVSLIAITIWPATAQWGVVGTGIAVVAVSLFPVFPLNVYITAKLIGCRSTDLYREYLYPFVASGIMFLTLWYGRGLVDVSLLVELIILVPAGAFLYLGIAYILERQFNWGISKNIQMLLQGIGN